MAARLPTVITACLLVACTQAGKAVAPGLDDMARECLFLSEQGRIV